LFVWGTWAIMLLFGIGFVAVYGCNVPQWDDWDVLPWLAGERAVSWEWLWATHNEHRIVIPKLLLLGLAWLSHCDLRAGMLFNVLALATASAALILAVRSRRGFTVAADAVFPGAVASSAVSEPALGFSGWLRGRRGAGGLIRRCWCVAGAAAGGRACCCCRCARQHSGVAPGLCCGWLLPMTQWRRDGLRKPHRRCSARIDGRPDRAASSLARTQRAAGPGSWRFR
jgi:hypothetical protein